LKLQLFILLFSTICFGFQKNEVKTDSIDFYLQHKKPLKALNFSLKQTQKLLQQEKQYEYCTAMLRRAKLFDELNDNENAIKTSYESLAIAEEYNFIDQQINIHALVGSIHVKTFNFSKAKPRLYKAKKLAHQLNKQEYLARVYNELFKLHFKAENDSTEYYVNKLDFYIKNSKNMNQKQGILGNFGLYYLEKKNFPLAKNFLLKAVEIAKSTKNKKNLLNAKNNLGVYYLSGEVDYKKAINIYKELIADIPGDQFSYELSDVFLNLSYSYEMLGDYKNAMLYTNKYLELQDQVFSGRLENAALEMETKYQISKIEQEYQQKNKELAATQKRNQRLILLLGVMFVLGFTLFYFFLQNLKLKQKNKLKDLDSELQYKIISATLDGQDQERNKISEVLHDNVSATLSSVGLHLSAFENTLSIEQRNDLKKTRALLKHAHDKVRDLSHELVPPLLVKFGLQFALKDLCEKNSNALLQFHFQSEVPKNKKFDHEFETKIYYFVSELFNNAIKHSQATEVQLSLKLVNDKLQILVSDNGIGFNPKEQALGFGLTQIKARVANMKGTFKVFSVPKEGTMITIMVKE
jgi:signal transduction histidine kinase